VWIIGTVAAWMVTPVLLFMLVLTTGWGHDCTPPPGEPDYVPEGCPREGIGAFASVSMLGMWIVVTVIVAVVIGVFEGRFRRFAYRRRTCAVLLTIAAPWAMVAYAVGNGLGRLSPEPAVSSFGPPPHR